MRSVLRPSAPVVTGLFLALLLIASSGGVNPAPAQSSSVDLPRTGQSFTQAAASVASDSSLVALATALMKARADTKISHSTYQKGVQIFKRTHPEFYGNFFGDPFFATYDSQYFKMKRYRRIAGWDVHPFDGFTEMFFCNPTGYDPAFDGRCQGITFAAIDFFALPSGVAPTDASPLLALSPSPSAPCRSGHSTASECRSVYTGSSLRDKARETDVSPRLDVRPRDSDTLRMGSPGSSDNSTAPRGGVRERAPNRIDVPKNVHTSIQTTAASLQRAEHRLRLRQQIRAQYGSPRTLSPRERAQIASQFADRSSSFSRRDVDWTREAENAPRARRSTPKTTRSRRPRPTPDLQSPDSGNDVSRATPKTDRSEPQRRRSTSQDRETSSDRKESEDR